MATKTTTTSTSKLPLSNPNSRNVEALASAIKSTGWTNSPSPSSPVKSSSGGNSSSGTRSVNGITAEDMASTFGIPLTQAQNALANLLGGTSTDKGVGGERTSKNKEKLSPSPTVDTLTPATITDPSEKGVQTGTPNPATVNVTPYTGNEPTITGYASKGVGPSGGSIYNFPGGGKVFANPSDNPDFRASFEKMNATGITPPTDNGVGTAVATNLTKTKPDIPPAQGIIDTLTQEDPVFKEIITNWRDYMEDNSQRESLTETYKNISKNYGIEELDTELMNMRNVIEGTEDDIRNEVTKAGGFATESQVQAMTASRNKQLIKNYNTLQETRNVKQNYLDKMIELTKEDRAEADRRFDRMMNFGETIMRYQDKMVSNAKDGFDKLVSTVGWDGLYSAIGGNPHAVSLVEKTYGLPTGGLSQVASTVKKDIKTDVVNYGNGSALINRDTGDVIKIFPGKTESPTGINFGTLDYNSPTYMLDLMSSTKGKKLPNQVETVKPIQKSIAVINQLADLTETMKNIKTDPLVGYLKTLNPYDFDARAVQAQLQAIVPTLARGVYGEVGVLTDQDIKNYIQTLPNITSTSKQNQFVTAMTLKTVQRNFESQLETLASSGYDISGFQNQYKKVVEAVKNIESNLGVNSPQNGVMIQTPKGQLDLSKFEK